MKYYEDEDKFSKDDVRCVYNKGVICSMWQNKSIKDEERICGRCGWNPQEETRRKRVLKKLVDRGEWVPHLYSLEHYG